MNDLFTHRPLLWVLDENLEPRPVSDLSALAGENQVGLSVAQTERWSWWHWCRVRVSTVFLSVDHSFGEGPPVLWETMVFGGRLDGFQTRYRSRQGAIAGHAVVVDEVFWFWQPKTVWGPASGVQKALAETPPSV